MVLILVLVSGLFEPVFEALDIGLLG